MTNLLARILLAILMFPLAVITYLIFFLVLERPLRDLYAILWSNIFTSFLIAAYWIVLWRNTIRWTPLRFHGTWVAAMISFTVSVVFGFFIEQFIREIEVTCILGGMLTIALWLILTVLLWRETPAERAERVRQCAGDVLFCPTCGYNMTGLYESRCPECGTRYTLDQLAAAQKKETIENTATASPDRTP